MGIASNYQRAQSTDLTPREQEVLDLIVAGYRNEVIANKMGIRKGTVQNHIHWIKAKYFGENASQYTRDALVKHAKAQKEQQEEDE